MNPHATTPKAFTYRARAGRRTAGHDAPYVVAVTGSLSAFRDGLSFFATDVTTERAGRAQLGLRFPAAFEIRQIH